MSKLIFNKNTLQGNSRREQLDGVEHLVLPVVAASEGVMNGLFYSSEVLQNNSQMWNGKPIPVGHPQVRGVAVSANNPDIQNNNNIGTVYNSKFEDKKLKAEFWINTAKAESLGHSDLIERLENGETVEVSTGLYPVIENNAGIFNNKSYDKTVVSMVADHIAILPNEEGACSVANGCGTGMSINHDDSGHKPKGCCGGCSEGKPCEGDKEKAKKLSVNEMKTKVTEFITNLFSQQDEFVELADTSVTKVATNQNKDMKAELIKKIIANTASKFSEGDKETLEALEINVLEGIHGSLPETKEPVVSANSEETLTLKGEQIAQFKEFVANSTKERDSLVAKVKEGYGLDDEQLANLSVNTLQSFAAKLEDKQEVDFTAKGGGKEVTTNATEDKFFDSSTIKLD